jgi:hypothetical protein
MHRIDWVNSLPGCSRESSAQIEFSSARSFEHPELALDFFCQRRFPCVAQAVERCVASYCRADAV